MKRIVVVCVVMLGMGKVAYAQDPLGGAENAPAPPAQAPPGFEGGAASAPSAAQAAALAAVVPARLGLARTEPGLDLEDFGSGALMGSGQLAGVSLALVAAAVGCGRNGNCSQPTFATLGTIGLLGLGTAGVLAIWGAVDLARGHSDLADEKAARQSAGGDPALLASEDRVDSRLSTGYLVEGLGGTAVLLSPLGIAAAPRAGVGFVGFGVIAIGGLVAEVAGALIVHDARDDRQGMETPRFSADGGTLTVRF